MALERGTFGNALAVYPLPAALTNSALRDADPVLFYALDYWRTMLATYLGARWTAECNACGLTAIAASPVAAVRHYDPYPYMQELQQQLPMLAAWRVGSRQIDRTAQLDARTWTWQVAWILPPLTAAQMERIAPLLQAGLTILDNRTDYAPDPGWESGADPWVTAQVDEIYFDSAKLGSISTESNIVFPTLAATVVCTERTMMVAGAYDPLAGTDVTTTEASSGTPFDPLVQFKT